MSNSWIISGTRVQLCSVRTLKEFCHKKRFNPNVSYSQYQNSQPFSSVH